MINPLGGNQYEVYCDQNGCECSRIYESIEVSEISNLIESEGWYIDIEHGFYCPDCAKKHETALVPTKQLTPDDIDRSEQKCTRYLTVQLTVAEYESFSQELSACCQEKFNIEDEKKVVMSDFKHRIDTVEARIKELSPIVNSRKQSKDISCTKKYFWNIGEYEITRDDTKEVIESGKIPHDERQSFMFDED